MLRQRVSDWISQLAALAAVIVVGIVMTILSPYFFTFTNLSAVAVQGSVTAIIAVGMTLVIVTAGIDLSVGSVAALTGVLGALLMVDAHLSWPVATVIALLIGGLIGFVNGALVGWARLAPFIATLGMMGVARGLTFIATGSVAVYGLPAGFSVLGQGELVSIPVPAVCLIVVIIVFSFIFNRTKLGRYAYAVGSNEEASRLVGIPVRRYLVMVYIAQGVLAGFGGMIATSRVASGQPNFGIGLELDAIAAAVIGGASLFGGQGRVSGAIIGAFLIQLIRNGSVLLDINIYVQDVIIGVVIWLAVAWDQFRRKQITNRSHIQSVEEPA
ncbi:MULTISPECIES: ABC transporter permease [unclassified Pseudactinotalea]|uniref:ABC transporter permease n=1 Tax=unclassified Pseudactinotalea TaxID=2649176 RepID=UPI00128D56A1|nr:MULTISPECIES: ABC transporter permease [unclassified Pseudactinotalea]MPV50293.1 ABC transporter permease [Pseudactinotalea sp. HY160]QGH70126.1 ABC transporter permease [Pseudactinotalea sp. HY158]